MAVDGRELRLQRLIGDGRAVIIAVDHGLFDGPIPAMENLPATVEKVNPRVDAVLLSSGMLRHCHGAFAQPKRPLAIVRLNWNTVYCFGLGYTEATSVSAVASGRPHVSVGNGLRQAARPTRPRYAPGPAAVSSVAARCSSRIRRTSRIASGSSCRLCGARITSSDAAPSRWALS